MALTVDEVYARIGGFRQYQWFLLALLGYCLLTTGALNGMIVTFIAAEPNWKCVEGYMNNTVCRFNKSITLISKNYKARCDMPREAWTFVDDFTSIVTEYDLVCDKSVLLSVAQSSYWIGMLIALLIGGYLSDKYGRRIVLCFGYPINVIASIISAVFPKYLIVFIVCRVFIGVGSGFRGSSAFTLLMEFTTGKYRPLLGVGCFVFWSVGLMILPMIGYFARDWKTYLLITSLCSAPCILLCWLIPESPRWLLLHNKEKEARAQLLKVAKMNKRTLPDDKLEKPVVLEKRASFRQLFSSWKVTKLTLITWNLWFTHALVYYGVSYGSVDLGGNRYLNFFLIVLVALPNNFVLMWGLKRFGRKACVICPLIITVVASAISVAIPADQTAASVGGRVTAAIIANFCIGISFNGIYVWGNELYPTVIRATALSMSSATARIGSFAASYIIWLIRIHAALPYGLLGVISIQAAILGLFLPDTRDAETLETMDDMKKPKNQTSQTNQEIVLSVHANDEETKREDSGED